MITFIIALAGVAGWIAFMIAEGAYHDLRVERDGYRARARAAETKLAWRTGVDL